MTDRLRSFVIFNLSFVIYRFGCTACRRDFFLRALGECVRADGQGFAQRAISQYFDALGVARQAALYQRFGGHLRARFERGIERVEIDHRVLDAKDVREPAIVGQATHQRQLSAFKV